MKDTTKGTTYYYVDETGDPIFLGRRNTVRLGTEGCSAILALGFLETQDPGSIRSALSRLRQQLARDPYFEGIPSFKKTLRAFHAKDDCPEVRMLVFQTLAKLDFKVQVVVGRKILRMFERKFRRSTNVFYDDLVSKLFENILHRWSKNVVCFSARTSSKRQQPYLDAIRRGVARFEQKWGGQVSSQVDILVQSMIGEPCLQAIDYALWAVYRAYTKSEMRFFNTVREKFSLVADPYDKDKYPNVYYDRERNPFEAKKISPL